MADTLRECNFPYYFPGLILLQRVNELTSFISNGNFTERNQTIYNFVTDLFSYIFRKMDTNLELLSLYVVLFSLLRLREYNSFTSY